MGSSSFDRYRSEVAAPAGTRLVDYAESPHDGGWTLRAALVRFAQPEPIRASAVLELIRRTDGVLRPDLVAKDPEEVADDPAFSAALDAASALDELAEVLARWANTMEGPPPVDTVDAISAAAHARLQSAGIPRETGPPRRGRP